MGTDRTLKKRPQTDTVHIRIAVGQGCQRKALGQKIQGLQGIIKQRHLLARRKKHLKSGNGQIGGLPGMGQGLADHVPAHGAEIVRLVGMRCQRPAARLLDPFGLAVHGRCPRCMREQPLFQSLLGTDHDGADGPQGVVQIQTDGTDEAGVGGGYIHG